MRNRRGMTLMELAVGTAVLSVMTLVTAGLFKAGIKSYNYTINQVTVLSNARKALDGEGSAHGMLWETREASAVGDLSSSALSLAPASGAAIAYSLSGTALRRTQSLETRDQAKGVASLQFGYYGLDDEGHVVESTGATGAALVTPSVSLQGVGDKTFLFYSGAVLENR